MNPIQSSLIAALFASLLTNGFLYVRLADSKGELAEYRAEVAERDAKGALAYAKLVEEKGRGEAKLQTQMDKQTKESQREQTALRATADRLLRSLRDHQARTSAGVPSTPADTGIAEAPTGGLGTGLLGQTGEEMVHEAYRADLIRNALYGCYAAYDRVKHLSADLERNRTESKP